MNWNRALRRANKPCAQPVGRFKHPLHGWGHYAIDRDARGANYRKPVKWNPDEQRWEYL